ncbi:hypothetical protein G7Z17_g2476 [Cylindrodendrum hubeiense]|uniref:Transcription factor domain-containing protein n=1 Tax=Cylindrodendrum hubeiense TaxID=595255 RepID=A0A9P5LKZ9_9HYPO|nr:hypothetical protein G7Z17_g2476 [Cylindrodendrum hubeiense]
MEFEDKRLRVDLACEICRKRKRKVCSEPQTILYYSSLEQQIALLQEYTASLEGPDAVLTRPKAIEDILAERAQTQPTKDNAEHDAVLEGPGSKLSAFPELGPSENGIYSSDASALNDVSSMMWRMTIRDDGETSFTGPSGNFCFPTVRHDIKSTTNNTLKASLTANIHETAKPKVDQATREHLFDIFANSINQTHQFVESYAIELLKIHTPPNMELLECAILAAGTVLSDEPESQSLRDDLSSYARSIALHQCHMNPDVYTVQALGILSWRELASDEENMAWMYNCDESYAFEFKELNFTQRQRLLLEAREELLSFYRQLDSRVSLTGDVHSPNLIYLHMSYNTTQLLIHRPYLKEDRQTSAYNLAVQSMSTAAGASARLIREHEKVASFENAPPFIAHSILTAAIALLLGATSADSTAKSQSISRFRTCFKALGSMQARFSRAKRAIILLRELAQRWNIVMALPIQYSFPLNMSTKGEETGYESKSKESSSSPKGDGFDGYDASFAGFDPDLLLIDPTTILDQGLFDFSTPGYELNMASRMFEDPGM